MTQATSAYASDGVLCKTRVQIGAGSDEFSGVELEKFSHRMQTIFAGPAVGYDAVAVIDLSCSVTGPSVGV